MTAKEKSAAPGVVGRRTYELHERLENLIMEEYGDLCAAEVYGVLESVKMRLLLLAEGMYQ